MHRLIETTAPEGSVIEDGGILWIVGSESPHWPGERESAALACRSCGADPCRRDGDYAVCDLCGGRRKMTPGDPEREAVADAMAELEANGLWETTAAEA